MSTPVFGQKSVDDAFMNAGRLIHVLVDVLRPVLRRGRRKNGNYRALDNLSAEQLQSWKESLARLDEINGLRSVVVIDELLETRKKQSPKHRKSV